MAETVKFKDLVAKNIKAIRLRLGLSQSELASRASVSVRYIQQLERCPGKNVSLSTVEHVAAALGVRPSELTAESRQAALSKREVEALDLAVKLLRSFRELA